MKRNHLIAAAATLFLGVAAPANAATYVLTDLGDLPGGGDQSSAYGINDAGQVVGYSTATTGARAFLWSASGGMQDLNDLIDPASGFTLTNARGINAGGQIAGYGTKLVGNITVTHAFLLTPGAVAGAVPEPATWGMMLFGFGGFGYAMRRRQKVGARIRFA